MIEIHGSSSITSGNFAAERLSNGRDLIADCRAAKTIDCAAASLGFLRRSADSGGGDSIRDTQSNGGGTRSLDSVCQARAFNVEGDRRV